MNRREVISLLTLVILVMLGAGLHYTRELISLGVAYKAKILCSSVFISNRDPESILNEDLAVDDLGILRYFDAQVDRGSSKASSSFMGFISQTAVYRPGLGCTLTYGRHVLEPLAFSNTVNHKRVPDLGAWPPLHANPLVAGNVDGRKLEAALDWAFSEPDTEHLRRTRAVVIVHKGQIIGERYAPGFDRDTPLIGWSMTKSVMHALVGVLVAQGKLSVTDKILAPEWQGSSNGRDMITLNHLLQMSSGLEFNEDYSNPLSDVTYMLLRVPDTAAYAAEKDLVAEPGSKWRYSSGSTNILSRFVRQKLGDAEYLTFPRRALFGPLGMDSAVIEPDDSGTFVGSSFMYATVRDWAKFGQLYLQDGLWGGKRILPEGWVRYATIAAAQADE